MSIKTHWVDDAVLKIINLPRHSNQIRKLIKTKQNKTKTEWETKTHQYKLCACVMQSKLTIFSNSANLYHIIQIGTVVFILNTIINGNKKLIVSRDLCRRCGPRYSVHIFFHRTHFVGTFKMEVIKVNIYSQRDLLAMIERIAIDFDIWWINILDIKTALNPMLKSLQWKWKKKKKKKERK